MKKETKTKKALAGLAEWLKESGHSEAAIQEAIERTPTDRDAVHLQAEAVLLYLEKPARFITKPCKLCGEYFGTNYRGVSYCSNAHRAKSLLDSTGIRWNPHKSEAERWGGEPPLVIPPTAVNKLREFAEQLLSQLPSEDSAQVVEIQEHVDEVSHQLISDSHTNPVSLLPKSEPSLSLDLDFLFLDP